MAIQDTYSKRNKKLSDVYAYEILSDKLKNQVAYIWKDFFSQLESDIFSSVWKYIYSNLCREHGEKTLANSYGIHYWDAVEEYFDKLTNIDKCLDVIEMVFYNIERTPEIIQKVMFITFAGDYKPEQAIKDLNARFSENDMGYAFEDKRIVRIDNNLLHREVIISTIHFLSTQTFKNANDEFMSAHEHFRHHRHKECLADCLKSLETTMKIICNENGWNYDKKDNASKLIERCINNRLVPDFLLSHFTSLRTSLESGVPTIRNKLGGHGQGTNKIIVPDHLASYMLYLTGTTINFLVSCQREIKPII